MSREPPRAVRLHFSNSQRTDLLREEVKNDSAIGKKINEIINAGRLVPDELTVSIIRARLSRGDCSKGFILDGFPRTVTQAEMLGEKFDAAILLELGDAIAVERLSGRRQCRECGKIYSRTGKCGACGGPLYQRDDDKPDVIKKRLEIYHTETTPLIAYYKKKNILKPVDASQAVNAVFADIEKALKY